MHVATGRATGRAIGRAIGRATGRASYIANMFSNNSYGVRLIVKTIHDNNGANTRWLLYWLLL